jgi:hypothetical protein
MGATVMSNVLAKNMEVSKRMVVVDSGSLATVDAVRIFQTRSLALKAGRQPPHVKLFP